METTTTSYGDVTRTTADTNGDTTTADGMENKFQPADWAVFSLMLVVSVAIGVVSAVKNRKKNTTQDYLLGGRKMSPVAVAISLLGSVVSCISVLGKLLQCIYLHAYLNANKTCL